MFPAPFHVIYEKPETCQLDLAGTSSRPNGWARTVMTRRDACNGSKGRAQANRTLSAFG